MFTGIIEAFGRIQKIEQEGSNMHFTLASPLAAELKIDQSLAHNGVCLTVVDCNRENYRVTAIQETLLKTNLGDWQVGDQVNLERAMAASARLDGHMVQGHVDTTATCKSVKEENGSWLFAFSFEPTEYPLLVDKGSVCVNGVSLTVVSPTESTFQVAIIPYTYEHTNFHHFKEGDKVNLEFDILGKYISKYVGLYMKQAIKS